MPIASGVNKLVTYKAETTYGTAPAASAAQALRRLESSLDLTKDTYQSNEIRTDFQTQDFRHGVRRVAGKLSAELSCKTFADFFAAALKRDFAAVAAVTGASITVAGSGPTWTVTRAAGSWLTDGFKVGTVIRLTAGAFVAANLNKNLFIVSLTALVATVIVLNGSALQAEGPIASATATVPGKTTFIPQTGHTDKSFSIEHYYGELTQSEVFTGCKIDKITVSLPPTGMATMEMDVVGQNVTAAGAQYFTTPTAATTTGSLAAVNGVLRVAGVTRAVVTGLTLDIDPTFSGDPVVGSNVVPAQFPGRVMVSGQMTAYFDGVDLRDAFLNETEIDLLCAFTADNSAAADFLAFALYRVKLGGSSKSDGDTGLVQTIPFTALLNNAGGTGIATEKTTILMQDAQA